MFGKSRHILLSPHSLLVGKLDFDCYEDEEKLEHEHILYCSHMKQCTTIILKHEKVELADENCQVLKC